MDVGEGDLAAVPDELLASPIALPMTSRAELPTLARCACGCSSRPARDEVGHA
jgi:hypothetical protein